MNRSSLYYQKKTTKTCDIEVMNEIRDIYLKYPFFGYRRIQVILRDRGFVLNRKKVQRLMRKAGIKALYPKKKTSLRNKDHSVCPYLLKTVVIDRPNYVWQVDITYIKVRTGFVYLICLIDVFSRKIMGWNLAVFLDTASCLLALESALSKDHPEIINSDQGCQFTSEPWRNALIDNKIKVSMDGKGRWADNIYIERFWRSCKYELVNLHSFETVSDARNAIAQYIKFYNDIRPHQALNYKTPNQIIREFNYALKLSKNCLVENSFLGTFNNSEIFKAKLS